jgi:hypothetical protein
MFSNLRLTESRWVPETLPRRRWAEIRDYAQFFLQRLYNRFWIFDSYPRRCGGDVGLRCGFTRNFHRNVCTIKFLFLIRTRDVAAETLGYVRGRHAGFLAERLYIQSIY